MADLDYQYLATLIARAKGGDSNSFAELYAATYKEQYQYAYHFLKDPYLAQDSVRQLYTLVLKYLDTLTDPYNFIPWLEQIHPQICENIAANPEDAAHSQSLYRENHRGMDLKSADTLLASIFADCDMAPNDAPITSLSSHRIYRKENYILPKVIISVILFGLLLMPLLFVLPKIDVKRALEDGISGPQYIIDVSSLLRVKSITAKIGENDQNIYEIAEKVYALEPTQNGTVTVTVTLENGQFDSQNIAVTSVDTVPPELLSYEFRNGKVYLTVSDANPGINYNNITGVDANGNRVKPESYDKEQGIICFLGPTTDTDVYIPDYAKNTLHAVIRTN